MFFRLFENCRIISIFRLESKFVLFLGIDNVFYCFLNVWLENFILWSWVALVTIMEFLLFLFFNSV